MLFNSYKFIFAFLPIVFFGFFLIAPRNRHYAALWLAVASVLFYGYWNPRFVLLLLTSIIFNYVAGYLIGQAKDPRWGNRILVAAISLNVALLCFFKYTNFFLSIANSGSLDIVLPLGISFFTFTQIAFLVDVNRKLAREYDFVHYLLFVTWFPHLVAGPVLHHRQMMPQFNLPSTYRQNDESIAIGVTLFSLGLFKKVILADQFAGYANTFFESAARGGNPTLATSWIGVTAYTLQIYFDFSGYSDMAIGLSRLFNIRLPLNFNSPYQAPNIIEFWRRWHMTLSTFLRDYLYVPLGGNRKGSVRRYVNLMTTMVLGGLWHGAGWTFVVWGALHGAYLVVNHVWQRFTSEIGFMNSWSVRVIGTLVTFAAVTIAWVPFRAPDLGTARVILIGMSGMNGVAAEYGIFEAFRWILVGLCIVWGLPNTQQWLAGYDPALQPVVHRTRLPWKPTRPFAATVGLIFAIAVLAFKKNSPFLYFQF